MFAIKNIAAIDIAWHRRVYISSIAIGIQTLTILLWSYATLLFEDAEKSAFAFKAASFGDVGNVKIGLLHQIKRRSYAQSVYICAQIATDFSGKYTRDLVFVGKQIARQNVKGDVVAYMLCNI